MRGSILIIKTLGELYNGFARVDLDTAGGFARVAQVTTGDGKNLLDLRAFKLMRHEINYQSGINIFESEIKLLTAISNDANAPSAIPRIHDCGFAPIELSHDLQARKNPSPKHQFISVGKNIEEFLLAKTAVQEKKPGRWLPYLVTEIESYDDNLLRQIHNQPKDDASGLFRLPTGEVVIMALQLLDVINYLHSIHHRAYMDWKPEHIYWNGLSRKVKLIDWNVTALLDDGPGVKQNIRDDLRLFCGAVLYIGLTFVDPDYSTKPIGPRPTIDINSPIPEIRHRYWTDKPEFYQRGDALDNNIKTIIRRGLNPREGFDSIQELKTVLINYAKQELNLTENELTLFSEPTSEYYKALVETRLAQQKLLQAQQLLIEAIKSNGKKHEFMRTFDMIKSALKNFPAS